MRSFDPETTVAQIVAAHYATARVFQKHEIDFCCHGNVTVSEACRGRDLDPGALLAELEATLPAAGSADADDPRELPVPALIARIVHHHHAYLRRALPYLRPIATKVAGVHGGRNGKLAALAEAFQELADSLEPHLDDEEQVLFPALMARDVDPDVIQRGLDRMVEEHVAVGGLLARIRSLSDGFTTPAWGCNTYRILMSELEALEADVLRHVHLENHVLMPRFAAARASC